MTVIIQPYKVELELMSNEIEGIIRELQEAPHNIYMFLNYNELIKKLKEALR